MDGNARAKSSCIAPLHDTCSLADEIIRVRDIDMPKLDAVDKEFSRLRSLPRNGVGAIADTYRTLHGILFLEEMRRAYLMVDHDGAEHQELGKTFTLCSDLLTCNVIRLIEATLARLRATDTPSPNRFSGPTLWIRYLLDLSGEIERAARTVDRQLIPPATKEVPLIHQLRSTYLELCAESESRFGEFDIRSAVLNHYTESESAVFLHNFKILSASIRSHSEFRSRGDAFDDDYFTHLWQCVDSMASDGSTYLDQFRLLHQVPELLAMVAADHVEQAARRIDEGDSVAAAASLHLASIIMVPIRYCLKPLVELMYPSEYFKFRRNLGGTSGSQSQSLGAHLLRRSYRTLGASYARWRAEHGRLDPSPAERAWASAFSAFRTQVYTWRQQHLLLPRNVLGMGATSLTGSRNAPEVVRHMTERFEQSDPAVEDGSPFGAQDEWLPLTPIERRILELTGDLTREVFVDIEERGGLKVPEPRRPDFP